MRRTLPNDDGGGDDIDTNDDVSGLRAEHQRDGARPDDDALDDDHVAVPIDLLVDLAAAVDIYDRTRHGPTVDIPAGYVIHAARRLIADVAGHPLT